MGSFQFSTVILINCLFHLLLSFKPIYGQQFSCPLGCSFCDTPTSSSSTTTITSSSSQPCYSCVYGYYLSLQTCKSFDCDGHLLFDPLSNSCLSVCPAGTFSNWSTRLCEPTDNCSSQYLQQTLTSKSRAIKSALSVYPHFFIVFDTFIKQASYPSGALEGIYEFTYAGNVSSSFLSVGTLTSISQIQNSFILLYNNSVALWNYTINTQIQLGGISQGSIKSTSQILTVQNEETQTFLVSSLDDSTKIMYLTDMRIPDSDGSQSGQVAALKDALFQMEASNNNQTVQFFDSFIAVQYSLDYSLSIKRATRFNGQLQLAVLTEKLACSSSSGMKINSSLVNLLEVVVQSNSTDKTFLLAQFANAPGVFLITSSSSSSSSTSSDSSQSCYQVDTINGGVQAITSYSTFYLGSFSDRSIKVYQARATSDANLPVTLDPVFIVNVQDQIRHFLMIQSNNESSTASSYLVCVLTFRNVVKIFEVTTPIVGSSSVQYTVTLRQSINSVISSPTKLLISPGQPSQSQPAPPLLFLAGSDMQIIDLSTLKILGKVGDFDDVIYGDQSKINRLLFSETLKIICSCSNDGRVVLWEAFDMQNPIYSYEILRQNQKCLDIVLFQDTILVAMFTNEVVVFEILNAMNISVYPIIKTNSTTTILANNQNIFILSDTAVILSSVQNLLFQGSFHLTSSPIQFFVTSQSDILLLDSENNLRLFNFDSSTNQLTLSTQASIFSASSSLSAIQLVEYAPSSFSPLTFSVYLSTTDKSFIALDSNLQEIDRLYQYGSLINRMYNFKNEMIFFLSKYDDGILGHQYFTESYDVKYKYFSYIGTSYFVQDIASVWKSTKNNSEIYSIIEVSPISYTTYSVEIEWSNENYDTKFGKFLFTPGQQVQVVLSDRQQKSVVVGTLAGQLRTAPIRRLESTPLRLLFKDKAMSTTSDNKIIHVKFSFPLSVLFVVQAKSLLCYDLHMHMLLNSQELNGSVSSISGSHLSESLKLFVVWSSNYLGVYNITDQSYNVLPMTDSNILINGTHVDVLNRQIFIYGTNIYLLDPSNLTALKTVISPPQGSSYSTCLFHPANAICKLSNSIVIFYDLSGTSLSKIQTVQLTGANYFNFTITTDLTYQQVFIYGASSIDVYSFQGIYISTISAITSRIIQFMKTPNCYIAITSATGYVLQRDSGIIKVTGSFIPAGGSITKAYYIAMYNQIAYTTDEIRYGQVLFFDLNTMLTAGASSNTYSNNGIGQCLKVSFDDDSKMMNYIDSYGNFQNIIFSSSKTTDNTIGISEMQAQTTQPPTDYVINWITNTVYVMNQNAIWVLNYNLMTRPYQRCLQRRNKLHLMIEHAGTTAPPQQQQQIPGMLLVDKNNHIYRYQDAKTFFEKDFTSTILDVAIVVSTKESIGTAQVTTQAISSIFLFFSTFSYVYSSNSAVNFLEQGYFQNDMDYQTLSLNFRSILCTYEGRIIVITVENTVVMIVAGISDGSNNTTNPVILSKMSLYQCDSNDRIISQYNDKHILFLGMLSGKLISINIRENTVNSSDIFIIDSSYQQEQQPSISKIHDYDHVINTLILSLSNGSTFKVDASDPASIIILPDQPISANSQQLLDAMNNSYLLIPSSYSTIFTNGDSTNNDSSPQTELFLLKECGLYILTIQDSKRARIYNLSDDSFIMDASFPDDQWKTAICSMQILLINSASQVNVYAIERNTSQSGSGTSITFLDKIRRYNRKDRITDIRIIDSNKTVIVFTSRIECIAMDVKQKIVQLVDTVQLTDPRLTYCSLNSNRKALVLIGIQSTGVFEKQVNFSVFELSSATGMQGGVVMIRGSQQKASLCESSLIYNYSDSISGKSQLDRLQSTPTNAKILLSVQIQNTIAPMPFLSSVTSSSTMIILRPQMQSANVLNINGDELQDFALSQLTLEGFEFKWKIDSSQTQRFALKQLTVSASSVNVTFRNITFSNGLVGGVNITGKSVVLFDGMSINDVALDSLSNTASLFTITKVDYLFISDVSLRNITVTDSIFSIKNVNTLVIQNLRIDNSSIKDYALVSLLQVTNLKIQNIQIMNCTGRADQNARQLVATKFFRQRSIVSRNLASASVPMASTNPASLVDRNLFELTGVNMASFERITMENCVQLKLLQTIKSFMQPNGILMLTSDMLTLKNIKLLNNSFPDGYQQQQHLILSHSSLVMLSNLKIHKNQGNLYFGDSTLLSMKNSTFESNKGISGAAMQFYLNQNIQISSNCSFTMNAAVSSGGALFFDTNERIFISKDVSFQHNTASIGGAIRILSNYEKSPSQQAQTEIIQGNFLDNHAKIYGKNIGRFPSRIEIYLDNNNATTNSMMGSSNEPLSTPIFASNISSVEIKSVSLYDLQSGGLIHLNFRLLDDEGAVFTIDQDSIQNGDYGYDVLNELNKYQIEVLHVQSSALSSIKGESLITVKQFSQDSNTFRFKSLEISAFPLTSVNTIVIKVIINDVYTPMFISTILGFRECQIGEIPLRESASIAICQSCLDGSYSLVQPNQTQVDQSSSSGSSSSSAMTSLNPGYFSYECKKCPISAKACSKSSIILEYGYWRQSNLSDDILTCNKINPEICDESANTSKQGCIEGHIGPLCESCDTTGVVWHGQRYTQSFKETDCLKCSSYTYQGSFIILSAIILQIYLLFSVLMFMNSYIYNSLSYYLRRMTLLPLSKSSIRDESTFFIKALMNYFQLSSILFKSDLSIFPSIFTLFPSFAGQPVSKIVIGGQCILPQHLLEEYGWHKLLAIAQVTFPFLFLLCTFSILLIFQKFKISQVGSFHKFTMINVLFLFFQPDCIRYFTAAISCRYIGQSSYLATNLMRSCNDEDYRTFKYSVVVTALLFWTLFPLVILQQLLKTLRSFKRAQQLRVRQSTAGKQSHSIINNNQTYLSSLESSNRDTLRSPYVSPPVTDRNPQCNVAVNVPPSTSDRNYPRNDENIKSICNSSSINSPNVNTNTNTQKGNQTQLHDEIVNSKSTPNEQQQPFPREDRSLSSQIPTKVLYNPLEFATTKYKFGYYYLEFKRDLFYWEFVRIYLKISIVVLVTQLAQLALLVYVFSIVLMFLYIFSVQHFKPFESTILLKLEVLSYFVLVVNILLSQIDSQYPAYPLKLATTLIHYGFIFFIIVIILKLKLDSQTNGMSSILRIIVKKLLPSSVYQKIAKRKLNSMRTLLRWRLIYKNLSVLREIKLNQQMKHIESVTKSKFINSPKLKKHQQTLQYSPLMQTLDLNSRLSQQSSPPQSANLADINAIEFKGLQYSQYYQASKNTTNPNENLHTLDQPDVLKRIEQQQSHQNSPEGSPPILVGDNNSNSKRTIPDDNSTSIFMKNLNIDVTINDSSHRVLCQTDKTVTVNPSSFRLWKTKKNSESIYEISPDRQKDAEFFNNNFDISFTNQITAKQSQSLSDSSMKIDALEAKSEKTINEVYDTKTVKTLTTAATKKGSAQEIK